MHISFPKFPIIPREKEKGLRKKKIQR